MARAKRKSKGNTSTDNHEILGGKCSIFRVAQSGDVWQFKMWVTEEQKYFRKSLRTKDFESGMAKTKIATKYNVTRSYVYQLAKQAVA
jgi:hypothetical protein